MFTWLVNLVLTILAFAAPMQGPEAPQSTYPELALLAFTAPPPPSFPTYDASTVGAASAAEVHQVDLPQVPPIDRAAAIAIARTAGWDDALIPDLLVIARCEAGAGSEPDAWIFYPGETGDSGRSLGWLQLNEGHFGRAAANGAITNDEAMIWWDPLINAKVAKWLYDARGRRFAGGGGWTCADKHGIYP